MVEVIECEEFGTVAIGVDRLLEGGVLNLDPRVINRGYFNVSLVRGDIVLRADRYVGLIPLNSNVAVRVRPRTRVDNLTKLLVKSGVLPAAISGFSRDYLPQFETNEDAEAIYAIPLVEAAEMIVRRGLIKGYRSIPNPPPWRGRLLASETIRRFRARGLRYRSAFDFQTLTVDVTENVAVKQALLAVYSWLVNNRPADPTINRIKGVLPYFAAVHDPPELIRLIRDIPTVAIGLSQHLAYYREPLWTAYLLLQKQMPNLSEAGLVALDSLVVDLSKVYEAYLRKVLETAAPEQGWRVSDGNKKPSPLFADNDAYSVHPDIIIDGGAAGKVLLDAKYKPDAKESDRYELLSFMEAHGCSQGGFVCPATPASPTSRRLGVTVGGKSVSVLRYDLGAADLSAEDARLIRNTAAVFTGADFV